MKSDASEHVFHSFVLGMNNVIQWGSDAIFTVCTGLIHAIYRRTLFYRPRWKRNGEGADTLSSVREEIDLEYTRSREGIHVVQTIKSTFLRPPGEEAWKRRRSDL